MSFVLSQFMSPLAIVRFRFIVAATATAVRPPSSSEISVVTATERRIGPPV